MTFLSNGKEFLSRYKLHILSFVFVLLFTGATTVFAVYPGTQWQPGETLDPGLTNPLCTPGSSNCSVDIGPGGSDTYVQYNDNGALGGDSNFTWDNDTYTFSVGDLSNNVNGTKFFVSDAFESIFSQTKDFAVVDMAQQTWFAVHTDSRVVKIGDKDDVGNSTLLRVNDTGKEIIAQTTGTVILGDVAGTNLGTKYVLTDSGSQSHVFTTDNEFALENTLGSRFILAQNNGGNPIINIGDIPSGGNGTLLTIDDTTQTINGFAAENIILGSIGDTGMMIDVANNEIAFQTDGEFNVTGTGVDNDLITADFTSQSVFLGDHDGGIGNDTTLTVDDTNRIVVSSTMQLGIGSQIGVSATSAGLEYSDGTDSWSWFAIDTNGGELGIEANGTIWTWPNSNGNDGDVLTLSGVGPGVGTLGWETPTDSPITIGTSGNTLYSSGLSGTGQGDTTFGNNIILGENAGGSTASLGYSNVLGMNAGNNSTNTYYSNFFGQNAGGNTSSASYSNFLGDTAGSATSASYSNFLGDSAGNSATNASHSNFFGKFAGMSAANASHATFIGENTGRYNVGDSLGSENSNNSIFIGTNAGYTAGDFALDNSDANILDLCNISTCTSILIGDETSTGGFSNSIALGKGATNTGTHQFLVDDSYTQLNFRGVNYYMPSAQGGASTFLKNNTGTLTWEDTSILSPISVGTSGNTLYSSGLSGTGQGGAGTSNNIILGEDAGSSSLNLSYSNFLGKGAGQGVSAYFSNFLGFNAGGGANNAYNSNFLGNGAGQGAVGANHSNFFGILSGISTNASYSNFLGSQAGRQATNASNSNFLGASAGSYSTNASNSNFLGASAGVDADEASNSNFFGQAAGFQATNASDSTFIGQNAGRTNQTTIGSINSNNSIFIGTNAGYTAADFSLDNSPAGYFSILIGDETSTGGHENSIALGRGATNTASHQFVVGTDSADNGISSMRIIGDTIECTITVGTGIGCSSDERLKTNIEDITGALDKILQLRTVTYNWNTSPDSNLQIGFLAQDLEQYFPELVATNEKGIKSVYYSQITPILVQAIRELDTNIKSIQEFNDQTFKDRLVVWFADIENGITEFIAGTLRARDQVCVGNTCITESQLIELLDDQNVSSGGGSSNLPEDNNSDTGDIIPPIEDGSEEIVPNPPIDGEDDPIVEEETPDEDIVVENEPEPLPEPIPEPVSEPAPAE